MCCRKVALLLKCGISLRVVISLFMLIKCCCAQRNLLGTRLKNVLANFPFMKANISIKRIDNKHVFYWKYDIYDIMTYSFFENIRANTNGGVFLVQNTILYSKPATLLKGRLPKHFFPNILWNFLEELSNKKTWAGCVWLFETIVKSDLPCMKG